MALAEITFEKFLQYGLSPLVAAITLLAGRKYNNANAEKSITDAAHSSVATMKDVMDASSSFSAGQISMLIDRIKASEDRALKAEMHAQICDKRVAELEAKVTELESIIESLKKQ